MCWGRRGVGAHGNVCVSLVNKGVMKVKIDIEEAEGVVAEDNVIATGAGHGA